MERSKKRKKKTPKTHNRGCKCTIHDQVCCDRTPHRVYTIGNKGYDRLSLMKLIELNVLSNRSKYVCNLCIEHGTKHRLRKVVGGKIGDTLLPIHVQLSSSESGSAEVLDNEDVMQDDDVAQGDDYSDAIVDLVDRLIEKIRNGSERNDEAKQKVNELLFCIGSKTIHPSLVGDPWGCRADEKTIWRY